MADLGIAISIESVSYNAVYLAVDSCWWPVQKAELTAANMWVVLAFVVREQVQVMQMVDMELGSMVFEMDLNWLDSKQQRVVIDKSRMRPLTLDYKIAVRETYQC